MPSPAHILVAAPGAAARNTLALAVLVALVPPVRAQQERPPYPMTRAAPQAQPAPEDALAAKLASPFLRRARWHLDWDEARAAARREGKPIFGYFTTANY